MSDFKKRRKALGLTVKQIAPLLGYKWRSVEAWDQGRREPSKSALMLLDNLVKATKER